MPFYNFRERETLSTYLAEVSLDHQLGYWYISRSIYAIPSAPSGEKLRTPNIMMWKGKTKGRVLASELR